MKVKPRLTTKKITNELERRIQEKGCTDDCDNCKLAMCARETTGAIIGELGDITFLN